MELFGLSLQEFHGVMDGGDDTESDSGVSCGGGCDDWSDGNEGAWWRRLLNAERHQYWVSNTR